MNFRSFIQIFCVLLCLTYLAGCKDDSPTNSSPAPATTGTSNEGTAAPQKELLIAEPIYNLSDNHIGLPIKLTSPRANAEKNFLLAIQQSNVEGVLHYLNREPWGIPSEALITLLQRSKVVTSGGLVQPPTKGPLTAKKSDILQLLLNSDQVDVNFRNPKGQTALMIAVENEDSETVQALLDAGADIEAKTNDGRTALMQLVFSLLHKYVSDDTPTYGYFLDTARTLLENGADPNVKDNEGFTAMMLINISHRSGPQRPIKAVEIVLEDIGHGKRFFPTTRTDTVKILAEELLKNGADPNTKSNQGLTPLMFASYGNSIHMVELLIAYGADPNARDNEGAISPLVCSIFSRGYKRGDGERVREILLNVGADPLHGPLPDEDKYRCDRNTQIRCLYNGLDCQQ